MRALAHPSRLALLEFLRGHTATATECSAVVDESPSACSYHLRTLASWGLVEEAESSDGRERPWRSRIDGFRASVTVELPGDATAAASLLLRQAALERDAQALTRFIEEEDRYEEAWQEAAVFVSTGLKATPAEVAELETTLLTKLEEIRGREPADPEAELVHIVFRAIPAERP